MVLGVVLQYNVIDSLVVDIPRLYACNESPIPPPNRALHRWKQLLISVQNDSLSAMGAV